MVYRRKQMV